MAQTRDENNITQTESNLNAFNGSSPSPWKTHNYAQQTPVVNSPVQGGGVQQVPGGQQQVGTSVQPAQTTQTGPIATNNATKPQTLADIDAQNLQNRRETTDARILQAQAYNNYVQKAQKEAVGTMAMGGNPQPIMSRETYDASHPIETETKEHNVSGSWTPKNRQDWRESFAEKENAKTRRKKALNTGLLALGDSLRHLGNLYYTTKGAIPQEYKYGMPQIQAENEAREHREYARQQAEADRAYKHAMDSYHMQYQAAKDDADRQMKADWYQTQGDIRRQQAESQGKVNDARAANIEAKTGYLPEEQARKQAESDAKIERMRAQTEQGRARLAQNQQRIALAYSKEARISGGGGSSKNDYLDVTYGDGTKRVHLNSFVNGASETYDVLVKDGTIKAPIGTTPRKQQMASAILEYPNHPAVKKFTDRMHASYTAGSSSSGNTRSSKSSSSGKSGGKSSRKLF